MNKNILFLGSTLLVACLFVYFPGLNAPFYLDDITSIVSNGYVTNGTLSNALNFESYKRALGSLSFFANHQVTGLSAFSFRAVNILIHCINGIFVFLLFSRLMIHCGLCKKHAAIFSIFAMGVFLLHPINTQAVTYIVQRFTSLMTLFCLASLYAYFMGRVIGKLRLVALAGVLFLCAVFVKETALVLVPIILAMEYALFGKHREIRSLFIVSFLLLLIVQFLVFLDIVDLSTLDAVTRDDGRVDRINYFKAQLYVLVYYIQSFVGLNSGYYLEYDDSVRSILSNNSWVNYAVLHCTILFLAVWLRKRLPLATFAILAFYGAQSIESAFIPIRDVIVEHRMYFPGVFVTLLLTILMHTALKRTSSAAFNTIVFLAGCLLLVFSGYTTYERNELWLDKSAFYRNELRNSPNHWRIKNALVVSYVEQGKDDAARRLLRSLIRSNKGLYYPPVLLNGILLFKDKNPKLAKFFELQLFSDINGLSRPEKAKAFYYRGERLMRGKAYRAAQVHFEQSLRMYQDFPEAVVQFANAHLVTGNKEKAEKILRENIGRVTDPSLISQALLKFE